MTDNCKGMNTPPPRATLIMYNYVGMARILQMKLIQPHSSKNNPSIFVMQFSVRACGYCIMILSLCVCVCVFVSDYSRARDYETVYERGSAQQALEN